MNKIGFNVLAWSAAMSDDLKPILDRLKAIGYDGAEFFVGSDDVAAYKRIGDHCKNIGLEVTTVFVLSPEENLVSPENSVRQTGLTKLKWTIDRAQELGSQVLCGPFHSAFATFTKAAPQPVEYERSAEVLHQAGEYAANANILLTPEALNRFECYLCNTMDQLNHLLKLVDHPNVKAMFDTHHANMEEKKLGDAIRKIAPRLGHFHISENDRGTPGSGHVPWEETFSTLAEIQYKGWLTIEGFTRNDPNFANSIGVWREFSEPWEMAESGYNFIRTMGKQYGL